MRNIIKIEEFGMMLLGLFLFSQLNFSWWLFWILFLTPDISALGYLLNNKMGAIIYNIFHHKTIAVLIYLLGVMQQNQVLQLIGIILFTHSSFDRMLGYGLKLYEGFKFTHLGVIGKQSENFI